MFEKKIEIIVRGHDSENQLAASLEVCLQNLDSDLEFHGLELVNCVEKKND